jgi:hypothetical protein
MAAGGIRETLEIVESVASLSEENAASAERLSSSTGLVSQQAQEVSEAATELTAIARELEGATARFKLTRDDEPADVLSGGPAEAQVANDVSRGRSRKAALPKPGSTDPGLGLARSAGPNLPVSQVPFRSARATLWSEPAPDEVDRSSREEPRQCNTAGWERPAEM